MLPAAAFREHLGPALVNNLTPTLSIMRGR